MGARRRRKRLVQKPPTSRDSQQGHAEENDRRSAREPEYNASESSHQDVSASPTNDNSNNEEPELVRWTRVVARLTAGLLVVAVITAVILGIHGYMFYLADETAKQSQRAFVAARGVNATEVGPVAENNTIYRIGFVWENSGNSSTESLEIFNFAGFGGGFIIEAVWPKIGEGTPHVLLPKATIETSDITFDGSALNSYIGKYNFMYGAAKYADVFGAKHVTLACFHIFLAPIDYTKAGAGRGITGTQCKKYNCADKDCRRYRDVAELKEILEFIK